MQQMTSTRDDGPGDDAMPPGHDDTAAEWILCSTQVWPAAQAHENQHQPAAPGCDGSINHTPRDTYSIQ